MAARSYRLKAIVFDFDGVIVESSDIKTEAFRKLFSSWPEIVELAVDHHLRNLGRSRFDKFEWIYRELLGRHLSASESRELGARYSKLVVDRVLECPFVPGAIELLGALQGRVRTAVASGTPQQELEAIVKRRRLNRYFDAVHGAPTGKAEILGSLLERFELLPHDLLMVGDGLSDYEAAMERGVRFILRRTTAQAAWFHDIGGWSVENMTELLSWLEDSGDHSDRRARGIALRPLPAQSTIRPQPISRAHDS